MKSAERFGEQYFGKDNTFGLQENRVHSKSIFLGISRIFVNKKKHATKLLVEEIFGLRHWTFSRFAQWVVLLGLEEKLRCLYSTLLLPTICQGPTQGLCLDLCKDYSLLKYLATSYSCFPSLVQVK